MTRLRTALVALLGFTLAGCGDGGTASSSWEAPPAAATEAVEATEPARPAAKSTVRPAVKPSAAPSATSSSTPSGTPSKTPPKPVAADRKLCATALSAKTDLAGTVLSEMDDEGGVAPPVARKAFRSYGKRLTSAAATGGRTEVTAAMRKLGAESEKIAAAADPFAVSRNPSAESASDRLDAACVAAGASGY